MYNSRGHEPSDEGEKYGRFGHTCGGFEYHCANCASSSLSHVSSKLNKSSNNAIKSPSICVVKSIYYRASLIIFTLFRTSSSISSILISTDYTSLYSKVILCNEIIITIMT